MPRNAESFAYARDSSKQRSEHMVPHTRLILRSCIRTSLNAHVSNKLCTSTSTDVVGQGLDGLL